ncbi:MAG: AI-2E family transporter [Chitinophagales bacterium]
MEKLFQKEFTVDRTIRLFIYGLIGWGLVVLLNRLSDVLLPFVLALVLAYLLDPIVSFIQKRVKNKRGIALGLTFLLILGLYAGFLAIIIPNIIHEVERFSTIFQEHKDSLFSGSFIPERLRMRLLNFINSEEVQSYFTYENLGPIIQKALPGLWASVTNVFGILVGFIGLIAVLLYLVFILQDYAQFRDKWHLFVPEKVRDQTVEFVEEFSHNMMGYFRQKTIIVIINIVLFAIAFNILGLPLATVLAFLVGILNYIPYLQNLGLIPCLLSAGLMSVESGQPFWIPLVIVLGIFLLVQILEDAVLVPIFMKEVTGMNPAIMLLSIAIWGSLMGILGMIIALPITTLIVTYYKKYVLSNDNELT